MVYNTQNYWVFGLFPSSGILENRKHDVSETGSVSVLRWRGEKTPTQLGPHSNFCLVIDVFSGSTVPAFRRHVIFTAIFVKNIYIYRMGRFSYCCYGRLVGVGGNQLLPAHAILQAWRTDRWNHRGEYFQVAWLNNQKQPDPLTWQHRTFLLGTMLAEVHRSVRPHCTQEGD
jgi:hypothetical protein